MNVVETVDESGLLARLCRAACEWLGCDPASISHDVLRRWLAQQEAAGRTRHEILRLLALGDEDLKQRLTDAVCVGETYFFRHSEQFQFVAGVLLPEWRTGAPRKIRSWSAGCSDGAEAYSLAACLRGCLPPSFDVEVLGSDIAPRALSAARSGIYGRSAVRDSAPLLFPVLKSLGPASASVHDSLRGLTTFTSHNLLDPPAFGVFDLIFCRNVLVYLTPEAAARVVENLLAALAPHGVLMFGPMDLRQQPQQLERITGAELQAFRARGRIELTPSSVVTRASRPPGRGALQPRKGVADRTKLAPPRSSERWVEAHIVALRHIERGEIKSAADILWTLRGEFPDYLPGTLELALLEARRGNTPLAKELMHELSAACAKPHDGALVSGPEQLPVSFYRSMAELFLERGELP
jgi:chemotaxis methyl-accepting protein methylase